MREYENGATYNNPTREYLYLGSQLLAKFESSATTYYHPDHLSNRVVSNSSGSITAQSDHFPFGENWYETAANKLKFTSYERDSESGDDYAMFRSYINRFGRFSSPDPLAGSIGDPQSLNRYPYTRNDPTNLVDPLGLRFCLSMGVDGMCTPTGTGRFVPIYDPWAIVGYYDRWTGQITPWDDNDGANRPVYCWMTGSSCIVGYQLLAGGDPISEGLKKLQNLLQNDLQCLAFLNSKGNDALQTLGDLLKFDLVGKDLIAPTNNRDGSVSITNAQTPGTAVGQAITVNTIGAFFNRSYQGIDLTTNRGRIRGGTEAAQLFILLHELAHNTKVLVPDAGNQKKVDQNDKALDKNCKDTIKSFSK